MSFLPAKDYIFLRIEVDIHVIVSLPFSLGVPWHSFILILKGQGSSNNWREWQSWRDIRIQEFHSCCFTGISLLFFVSLQCHPVILKILRNKLPANIGITNFSSLDLVANKESVISVNKVPTLSALQCPLYHCKTLRKEGCQGLPSPWTAFSQSLSVNSLLWLFPLTTWPETLWLRGIIRPRA